MCEITCAEFVARIDDALAAMTRDWEKAANESPDEFPDRMTLADWSQHFCCTVLPDLELRARERALPRRAA